MSIEAMKQALNVLENVRQYDSENLYGLDDEITALRQAIEQAEKQEPVAWVTVFDDIERRSYGKPAGTHFDKESADNQIKRHFHKRLCKLRVEPLYTAPPKREWQGLTDAEIFDVIRSLCIDNETAEMLIHVSMDEYRAIETKLKEKNA